MDRPCVARRNIPTPGGLLIHACHWNYRKGAACLSAAPLAPFGVLAILTQGGVALSPMRVGAAFLIGGVLASAGSLGRRYGRTTSAIVTLAVGLGVAVCVPAVTRSPNLAMFLGLCAIGLTFYAWRPAVRVDTSTGATLPRTYGSVVSAVAAIVIWFAHVGIRIRISPWGAPLCAVSEAIAIGYAVRWALTASGRNRRILFAGLFAAVGLAAVLAAARLFAEAMVVGVLPAMATLAIAAARRADTSSARGNVFNRHARLLVITFFTLCLIGTALLSLPACSANGFRIPFVDAAFTAVSAVCVTGLIVRDTPNDFSAFGQAIILLLIQVGGLGIMTFATTAIGLFGRRMSLKQERVAAELLNERNRAALFRSLYRTMVMAFGFEFLCAPILAVAFARYGDGAAEALWRGLFTSVSAFCNAGFALQTTNLVPYQNSGVILHVVAALVILGGLSPIVISRLPGLVRGGRPDLRTKVILTTTGLLLAGAFALILALEWSASLGPLSFADKLSNAWFQAVTPRTAGFNSVDLAAMRPPTLTILIILMFIGGAPGGTAGGIKVTTAFVLAMAIVGALRGRWEITVFRRRIPHSTVYRATAIATLGALVVAAALIAIQITQPMAMGTALFEVVSALGTVGLSTGGTVILDGVGKIIIMTCMFLGRVGPLTAFLLLYDHHVEASWKLPEEDLELG